MKYIIILMLMFGLQACVSGGYRCIMPACNLPGAQYYPYQTMTTSCCTSYVTTSSCGCGN